MGISTTSAPAALGAPAPLAPPASGSWLVSVRLPIRHSESSSGKDPPETKQSTHPSSSLAVNTNLEQINQPKWERGGAVPSSRPRVYDFLFCSIRRRHSARTSSCFIRNAASGFFPTSARAEHMYDITSPHLISCSSVIRRRRDRSAGRSISGSVEIMWPRFQHNPRRAMAGNRTAASRRRAALRLLRFPLERPKSPRVAFGSPWAPLR